LVQKVLKNILIDNRISKLFIYVRKTFPSFFKETILRFCSLFSELDSPEREEVKKQIISLIEQFKESPEKQKILQEIHNIFIPRNTAETHFEIS